jgi:uncharacterized protein (DUF1778 family)
MIKNLTETIAARFTEDERQEIEEVAEALEVRTSDFVRDTVRAKVKRIRKTHPKFQTEVEAV